MQRPESNYYSRWWALIYDQWNETGDRSSRRLRELEFYRNQLQGTCGPNIYWVVTKKQATTEAGTSQ